MIITKTMRLSYHIIVDKYLLTNIISDLWWYISDNNYYTVSLMISVSWKNTDKMMLKISYHIKSNYHIILSMTFPGLKLSNQSWNRESSPSLYCPSNFTTIACMWFMGVGKQLCVKSHNFCCSGWHANLKNERTILS